MWWLLLIYFALNIVITAVSLVINWHFTEWKAKDIVSVIAMVLFGVPILVFGLIYCYILGKKDLKKWQKLTKNARIVNFLRQTDTGSGAI